MTPTLFRPQCCHEGVLGQPGLVSCLLLVAREGEALHPLSGVLLHTPVVKSSRLKTILPQGLYLTRISLLRLGCGCSARHHLSNLILASHQVRDYSLSCNDISV